MKTNKKIIYIYKTITITKTFSKKRKKERNNLKKMKPHKNQFKKNLNTYFFW